MREVSWVLTDPSGLHARLVARIAGEAARWRSSARVGVGDRTAGARDLMGLMGLDAACGERIRIEVEGPDERQAAAALGRVLEGM